jgi:hypothetical protein
LLFRANQLPDRANTEVGAVGLEPRTGLRRG